MAPPLKVYHLCEIGLPPGAFKEAQFYEANAPTLNFNEMSAEAAGLAGPKSDPFIGPHPSFIEVAKPYIFEQQIQKALAGISEAKDVNIRLQGIAWVDSVRKALQL